MQFHGVLGCFSPTCGSSLLSARSCKMHDRRDLHVEPEHPDQAVTFTTESSEVPPEESGASGVNGEKQDCLPRRQRQITYRQKKQTTTSGLTVNNQTQS